MAVVDKNLSVYELYVISTLLQCKRVISESRRIWAIEDSRYFSIWGVSESWRLQQLKYTQELYKRFVEVGRRKLSLRCLTETEQLLFEEEIFSLSQKVDIFKSWLLSSCRLEIQLIELANTCQFYYFPVAAKNVYKALTGKRMPQDWFAQHGLSIWQRALCNFKESLPEERIFGVTGKPLETLRVFQFSAKHGPLEEHLRVIESKLVDLQERPELYNQQAYAKMLEQASAELERQSTPHLLMNYLTT